MFTHAGAIKVKNIINDHITIQAAVLADIGIMLVGREAGDVIDIIQTQYNIGYIFTEPSESVYGEIITDIEDNITQAPELYVETENEFLSSIYEGGFA